MAEEVHPGLIPPPSIGESAESKGSINGKKIGSSGSKLWILVLLCVVVGVGLGLLVYQQSLTPKSSPTPSPRSSSAPQPSPSPATPDINVLTPLSKKITFPKAGEVMLYVAGYGVTPELAAPYVVRLTTSAGSYDVQVPRSAPAGDKMISIPTGVDVVANQQVTMQPFDSATLDKPSFGWIKPTANKKCNGSDASQLINWAAAKIGTETTVETMCWADWGVRAN